MARHAATSMPFRAGRSALRPYQQPYLIVGIRFLDIVATITWNGAQFSRFLHLVVREFSEVVV